jgi:hypothetical protein
VGYIATTAFIFAGARPFPASASYAGSPATSARSTLLASRSGMFSALPRVLRGSIVIVGSASFTAAAKASPKTGNPPPGVAVASESLSGSLERPSHRKRAGRKES